jgi:hypothetical protein
MQSNMEKEKAVQIAKNLMRARKLEAARNWFSTMLRYRFVTSD